MVDQQGKPSCAGQLKIRAMEDQDVARWDAFVLSRPNGTFFHRAGWRTIFRSVFRLNPRYLLAERDSEIVGVLPLVLQRSLFFGTALLSLPFCVEGGPLTVDGETDAALTSAALALQRETGAPYLEFRSRKATRDGWTPRKDLYATFCRHLSL